MSGGKIFHLTAHMLPLYLVKHNALFCIITLLIAKNVPTSDDHNFNKR